MTPDAAPPDAVEELLARVLAEAAGLDDPAEEPQLRALRRAVLLEDVLGIVLADADLDPAVLGALDGALDDAVHAVLGARERRS